MNLYVHKEQFLFVTFGPPPPHSVDIAGKIDFKQTL
jgi:hypothetical protein